MLQKVTRGKMIDGQWRAARALIGWSQTVLAERIGVSVLTIKRMESGADNVSDDVRKRAREALEKAGIDFINSGQPGVRLRAKRDL
jgi:transcriptional regulator with XRE-family HTH domain